MMARPWGRPRCPLLSGNNAGPAIAAINAPTATGNPALSDRIGSTAFSKKAWMRAADGASSCTDFSAIGVPELSRQNRNRLFVPNASIWRSEEHTSELQSLMRISYAVFCLKKKKQEHHKKSIDNTKRRQKNTRRDASR